MKLTCPKSPHCAKFARWIETRARAREIVDQSALLVYVEDPLEMRMTRRFSDQPVCVVHGVAAIASLNGS